MFEKSILTMVKYRVFILLLPLVLGVCGCHGDQGDVHRVRLSGKVHWEGKPLQTGMLRLIPEPEGGGQESGGEITNGQYRILNKGGVIPGTYRIEVTSERIVEGAKLPDGLEGNVTEQFLPEKFNAKSAMTIVVPENISSFQHDIDLQ